MMQKKISGYEIF